MSVLSAKHFHDEQAAYEFVEARVWPNGPICPHCGTYERIGKLAGNSTRIGTYKCYECRKPFTVKVGTIFESSHVKLHLWLQAIFLLASSKKGISSNQLHRTLGVTLKTAWFMSHRIREAMRDGSFSPMGGSGKIVEADETYIGRKKGKTKGPGYEHKRAIFTLVERDGRARSFHIDQATIKTVTPILQANVDRETSLMTDDAGQYRYMSKSFAKHGVINHSAKEYVRGEISTNTVEGFFSIFKRGMKGVYQHCGEQHLHRYLAEYDFRYNERAALGVNDEERASRALKGVVGKRLTYRTTGRKVSAHG
ncbi:MAG: IS1595 family transposase [Dongiaceae bacterium]